MTKLHLGCGDNHLDGYHNVDVNPAVSPDAVVDLNETPWPWDDNTTTEIRAEHVFEHLEDMEATLRECERVLQPGGVLNIAVPIGHDAYVDPDHKHIWGFETPEMYCGNRPWDVDVGLTVQTKEIDLWPHAPGLIEYLWGGVLKLMLRRYEPGRWAFDLPLSSGEYRVVFRK